MKKNNSSNKQTKTSKQSSNEVKNKKKQATDLQKMKNLLKISEIGQGRFRSKRTWSFVFELDGTNIDLLARKQQEEEVNKVATLYKLLGKYKLKIYALDEKVNLTRQIENLNHRDDLTEDEQSYIEELTQIYEGSEESENLVMKKFYFVVSGAKKEEYQRIVDIVSSSEIRMYELSTHATRLFTYNLLNRDGLGEYIYLDDYVEFPANLKNTPKFIKLNDKYVKTIMVSALPPSITEIGLVNELHDHQGVNSIIEIVPENAEDYKTKIDQRKNYNNEQINSKKTSIPDKRKLESDNDYIDATVSAMTANSDLFYRFEIFLQLTADSIAELNALESDIKSKCSRANVKCDSLELVQLEGFLGTLPWLTSTKQWKLNSYTTPIAALYPQQISTIIDDDGVFLGTSTGEELIVIDLFSIHLPNPNVVVVGQSGNGKSIILKKIALGYAIKPKTQIFIFDSDNHEYVDLTLNCGGEIINPGIENMLNIFEIRNTGVGIELDEMGEIIGDDHTDNSKVLDHISWLKEFVKIYYPDVTTNEQIVFEKLCMKLYENKGITDSTLHKLKPKDYPIVTDLWNLILEVKAEGTYEIYETPIPKDILDNLQLKISSMYNGPDSIYFNGHTTLSTTTKIVNFDILPLQKRERRVQQAVLFMYINYIWDYIENPENQDIKKLLMLDEIYLLVNRDNPMMVTYINNIQKRNRKYAGANVCATQQLGDLNDPAIKSQTMSILSNPALKIIHNVGEADSSLLHSHLKMADHEIQKVASLGKLNALIKHDKHNYQLQTYITTAESKLFGTAGMSFGQK